MQLALAFPTSPRNTLFELKAQSSRLWALVGDNTAAAVAQLEEGARTLNELLRSLKKELVRCPDLQKAVELYEELDDDATFLANSALRMRRNLPDDE